MPKRRIMQGETLPRIAAAQKLQRWEDIWEAGENAELKKTYDPCVLPPGEEIFVPEPKPLVFDLPTGKHHRIVVPRPKLSLAVVLQKFSGTPLTEARGTLACAGKEIPVTLDGTGKLNERIPVMTDFAEFVFAAAKDSEKKMKIGMQVGHLDPLDRVSGWRGRLSNLGYPVEFDDGRADDDESCLRLAIEEFQCEHGLRVTGERDDATSAKLVEIHGS
jgi:hypothetical protein